MGFASEADSVGLPTLEWSFVFGSTRSVGAAGMTCGFADWIISRLCWLLAGIATV
jgi:hypothetical protein